MLVYERDPAEIYRRSFEIIRSEAAIGRLPADIASLVIRLIHACGMVDIVEQIAFSPDLVESARAALRQGAPILCDTAMTAAGVMRRHLRFGNEVNAGTESADIAAKAQEIGNTRSAAGIDLWAGRMDGAIVAIGNAPTALFRLIERIDLDGFRPAAILAFPVGFVGAAESKELLISAGLGVPYVALRGRRGGSAMAAAAVNALLLGETRA
jgi:precorrin-8X/cobalt-precorrin-8 methylmutase